MPCLIMRGIDCPEIDFLDSNYDSDSFVRVSIMILIDEMLVGLAYEVD